MPGSDEATELGGLARSIDALFSQRSAAGEAVAESVEDLAQASTDPAPQPEQHLDVETPQTEVVSAGAEPAEDDRSAPVQEASADQDDWGFSDFEAPEAPEAPEGPGWDVAPGEGASSGEGRVEPIEAPTLEAAPGERPPSGELAEAVEAFLGGAPAAAERVTALAAPLLEHFTLDPLADAVERLVHAAGDPPDEAIMAVAHSAINPAVASKLVQRMGAEPEPGRGQYVVLAQRLGKIMAIALRGALTDATERSARRAYYDALLAMGETSRPIIEGMIDDDNRFLVRNAVAILGEMGGDRAVELVTSALANTDPRVRKEALLTLAKLGAEEADQLIVAYLGDSDPGVRTAAALAAGELRVERALRPILELLGEERDPDACIPLLRALGALGDPGAVPAIEKYAVTKLLSKPRSDVRVAAYRALHRIGTPHAQELLTAAVADKDAEVRSAVRELVEQ